MAHGIGRVIAAAMILAGPVPVLAEPAPAPAIDPGRYDTPWGAGELRISGPNATLTLDDGSLFWGTLGNSGREWTGRWARTPRSARADRAQRPCSDPRGAVPSTFPVPPGVYWGRFTAHSVRSNTSRALSLSWSACRADPAAGASRFNVVKQPPRPMTEAAAPGRAVPSPPYDGPCHSVSARAVARITPCSLDFARPFRVTLLKDMQKPVTRISFTPLIDDLAAVAAALRANVTLPVHSDREVYQVVRGDKLHLRGSTVDVTPPATICQHDSWIVNVIDGTGERHPGNGIIIMSCGPHRIGREAVPVTGGLRPVDRK